MSYSKLMPIVYFLDESFKNKEFIKISFSKMTQICGQNIQKDDFDEKNIVIFNESNFGWKVYKIAESFSGVIFQRLPVKAAKLYSLVYEVALKKYEYELQREKIISEQAKNIQAVFSILSVALLTLLPILLTKLSDTIPRNYLVISYYLVFVCLIFSFIFACFVQIRKKKNFWDDIEKIENIISDNYETLTDDAAQKKWLVDNYKKIQKDFTKENNEKMFILNISQGFIITAVILILISIYIFILL